MQADREREAEAAKEQLRREQEQDEAELSKALQWSEKLDKEATLKRKRDRLGAEPPAGPDTTKLRLAFPNGSKIDRKFTSTQTLQEVRDFVDVYLGDNEVMVCVGCGCARDTCL